MSNSRTVLEGVDFDDLYGRIFPDKQVILKRLRKAAGGVRGVESGDFLECLATILAEISAKVDAKAGQPAKKGEQ